MTDIGLLNAKRSWRRRRGWVTEERRLLEVVGRSLFNVPAINLYTKLGFEHYASNMQLELQPRSLTSTPSLLPAGFRLETTDDFTWRPRFAFAKRIAPEKLSRFEPVEEGRYKKPWLTRVLFPLLKRAEGLDVSRFVVNSPDGEMVAYAMYDTRTRQTGRNTVMVELDPNCPELASYLVGYMLNRVLAANPDKVIEFNVPDWQEALLDAAKEAGFELRAKLLTMGYLYGL
jgi:hypothetical protein